MQQVESNCGSQVCNMSQSHSARLSHLTYVGSLAVQIKRYLLIYAIYFYPNCFRVKHIKANRRHINAFSYIVINPSINRSGKKLNVPPSPSSSNSLSLGLRPFFGSLVLYFYNLRVYCLLYVPNLQSIWIVEAKVFA